ncbi:MAG TPA: hypothetical protein VFH46_15565, partial [Pyrinomonadaceae bacterium]|nr:hypothetical protein [Pyrinomonadaceae bacterium]
ATATSTPATAPAPVKAATPEPRNTVKRVLMPLEKKPVDAQQNATKPSTTVPTPSTAASGAQRPRRIQP